MTERLGRYELGEVLGEGGMGVVYSAWLTGPGGFRKPVALKVLKTDSDGLAREARLGGLLQHPNLVEVYALECVDGRWVCAMERVPGGTLAGRAPMPPSAVIDVGLQVCAGLAHAHARVGLVHLDLKPSNLLLAGRTVKIGDFGIARARGFAVDGRVRGTPAYMSPEQAAGKPVDGRSDLYSLGLCLYELATGRRPVFDTDQAETWSTIEAADIDIPTRVLDDVPQLAPILARCLVEDPERRIGSAEDLADLLRAMEISGPSLGEVLGMEGPESRRTGGSGSLTGTRPEPTQSNLLAELDAFVGREGDLLDLERLVRTGSLVTLKGMGGSGKTRLALHFGGRWRRLSGGQTWVADLAAARLREDVIRAVAEALSIPLAGGSEVGQVAQLGHALAGRGPVLLILDNYEQVVEHADLAAHLAGAGPDVRVLVTSREPLREPTEVVHEVAPLPVEDAVALLVHRSRDRGREIEGDPALEELVRRLDGLPLALELAAARMTVLSPAQILARLDQRLQLLQGGDRVGRHAALRATLDGSWEALDGAQQATLAQLSVFRGGFELEAAEQVVALPEGAPWVLDLLGELVERSLVVRRRGLGQRFDLLETVRVYAAEKLGDAAAAEERHGRWYAMLCAASSRIGPAGFIGSEALGREFDNLAAATDRASARGDAEVAVTVGSGVLEVLDVKGPIQAARRLVAQLGGMALADVQRVRIDLLASRVLRRSGKIADALARLHTVAELARSLGEKATLADALNHIGTLQRQGEEHEAGLASLLEAEALYEALGDVRNVAVVWGNRAAAHYVIGDIEAARVLYVRALQARRDVGDRRGQAHLQAGLAVCAQVAGRAGEARSHYQSSLRLSRDVGDKRGEAFTLANLGVLASDEGDFALAEKRWVRSLELRRHLGERAGEGVIVGYLAMLAVESGQMALAQERGEQALAIHRSLGARRMEANALGTLGGIAVLDGRFGDARELLEQARTGQVAVGDRVSLGVSLLWWGRMCRSLGEPEQAWVAFDAAVDAIGNRHLPSQASALAWRGWAWHARGHAEAAREDVERALHLFRSTGFERGVGEALVLKALVQAEPDLLDEVRAMGLRPEGPTAKLLAEAEAILGLGSAAAEEQE